MDEYSEAVATIVEDYLERVRGLLQSLHFGQQEEFLKELRSHIYEAYQESSQQDGVPKILGVLRKLGEPVEVVSDRLPESLVRSGAKHKIPLYVLGGIFIAIFGIPLGFGGVAVLLGVLVALVGVVVAYYAAGLGVLLAGTSAVLVGVTRMYHPELWDNLVAGGFIHIDEKVAEFLDLVQPSDQGALIVAFGFLLVAIAIGMIWLGKYPLRGVRFLFALGLGWVQRIAHRLLAVARTRRARFSSRQADKLNLHSSAV